MCAATRGRVLRPLFQLTRTYGASPSGARTMRHRKTLAGGCARSSIGGASMLICAVVARHASPLSSSPSGEACSATTAQMSIKPPPISLAARSHPPTFFRIPHGSVLRLVTRRYGAFTPAARAQTRRRVAAQKNNLRGWQLQQAGVGVGCGPGPLRNAGIGSPGCGHTIRQNSRPRRRGDRIGRYLLHCIGRQSPFPSLCRAAEFSRYRGIANCSKPTRATRESR